MTFQVILAPLSYEEHVKNPTPSSLVLIYTFCKALFVAAFLRTLHMSNAPSSSVVISSIATAAYALFFLVEAAEKRSLLKAELKVRLLTDTYLYLLSGSPRLTFDER